MESVQQIKNSFSDKNVQFLLIDENGMLIDSCDSIFKTDPLAKQPVGSWFPLVESILMAIPQGINLSEEIHFPKIKSPFEFLPGIYDFYFNIQESENNSILWRIYDYTSFYTTILKYQQQINELRVKNEQFLQSQSKHSSPSSDFSI